jgi:uncharacterized protein YukE
MATQAEIQAYLRKKMQEEEERQRQQSAAIAPVVTQTDTGNGWTKGGLLADGYQFGDVLGSVFGTVGDVASGIVQGAGSLVEGVVDLGIYGVGGVASLFGANEFAEGAKQAAMFDASDYVIGGFRDATGISDASFLDENLYGVAQGLGQVGAIAATAGLASAGGASAAAANAITTGMTFASGMGGGISEAYRNNASDEEAFLYGALQGGIDTISEMMFAGLGKGVKAFGYGGKALSSADDMLAKAIGSKFKSNLTKNTSELLVKSAAEGVEELAAGFGSAVAKKMTYMSEEDFGKLLEDENLMKQFAIGALTSGIAQSGALPGLHGGQGLIQSTIKGQDLVTGLTKNEQAVIDRIAEEQIKQKEKNGEKLSKKEKNAIYETVTEDLEKGNISTSVIEEMFGGDSYKAYQDALEKDNNAIEELKKLYQGEELQQKIDNIVANSERTKLQEELSKNVREQFKDTKLEEAYLEKDRGGEKFRADLSKMDEKLSATYQKAIDSGVLNNRRKTHEAVDWLARIAAKNGIEIDFTNTKKIQESGLGVKNAVVNGYTTDKGFAVNVESAKYINTTVGHEITHILEDSKGYDALAKIVEEYATEKGIYADRYRKAIDLYENVDGYKGAEGQERIKKEVIADLVGDYLFTDKEFVKSLYVKDRNIFQKIYDEIKYLCKVATAGSKESRQLLEVKKAFEEAYQAGGKATSDHDIRYSLSSMGTTFFGDENASFYKFEEGAYKKTPGYQSYVNECLNNYKQTRGADYDEAVARKEIEDSIDGIVRVGIAAKKAGYDIFDDGVKRSKKDSKNRLLFSSLEPNSDYFTSSDISTICDKRQNFADIYDDIVRAEEAKGVPQGKRFFDNIDNYFYLHGILAEKGLTQPCRQCYVESMRKNLAPMASAFLRLVNETNANNTANDQLYQQKGKNKGTLKTNNAALRERVLDILSESEMSASDLTVEMLTTEDGLAQLKITAPLVYEAFNSFYGQSKPKMPKSATPFRFGELTALLTDEKGKIKQSLVDKINATGGFRLQSYSDFQIKNYTDVLQVIFEASTLGLNGHAYTKVPAFLEATEGTNLKRNISIFMYKDGNEWKLDRNDSFPYTLEEIYDLVRADKSGNTGIIAVSQNEDMSAWIMANDLIAYGIPFHKSGLKMGTVRDTVVKEDGREIKGYSGTKDHTRQQTEVWATTTADHKALTKVKNGINIYEFWDFENKENLSKNELIEKNVKRYIDECVKAGYKPKFREYVENNSKVLNSTLAYAKELGFVPQDATIEDISFKHKGYTIPYGYYKFLGDFAMFTPDGKASPYKTLSLNDYDFDKAVRFFKDSETLRRNEILQQFANDGERQKYAESDLSAGELLDVIKQKRASVVGDVLSRYGAPVRNSLSHEGEHPIKRGNLNIRGEDIRLQAPIGPVRENATSTDTEAKIAPLPQYDETPSDPVSESEFKSRVESLYDMLKDKQSNRFQKVDGYSFFLSRNKKWDSATITVKNRKGETLKERIEGGRYWTNKELWYKAAGMVAKKEFPNVVSDEYLGGNIGPIGEEVVKKNRLARSIERIDKTLERDKADLDDEFQIRLEDLKEEFGGRTDGAYQTAAEDLSNEYQRRLKELEDKAEEKRKKANTANQRRSKQDELGEKIKNLVGNTMTWVDKKLGLSYKANTLRRNLRDIVRDENGNRDLAKADAIYEELQGKYNQHEAELNREANRIKKVFADMKITNAESEYIQMLGEFRHNPSTTLTEERVKDFLKKHKNSINEAKVDKAIELARETYDSLLMRVNEVLREQGMKEIEYRKGYFPHFTEEKQGFLAKLFNWKTQNNEIPTDIAGITEEFNPVRSYQPFNKQRLTDKTDYNFLKGMDNYVFGALDWIYHIEDIQKRRAFENHIRYTHSEKGVQEKIDAIRANDEYDADEMQDQIDLVYREAGNPLNNFVTDLRAGTNRLANKKSSLDRGMEEMVNRKVYSTLTNLSNRVSANMVGGSISSVLTNFIPITQSWGSVSPISSLRAMFDTIKSSMRDDGMIEKSNFLTNRLRQVENLYKTKWDKFGEGLGWLMEGVDSFTSQTVWRSKYLENISSGMSESQAIANADQFAENVMAGRSRGNMPTIFESKNPLIKTLTAFQLEVSNQYGYMFKDMPQDVKNNSKGRLIKGYATMFLGAYAYNTLYSALTGRDAAFDPIGIIEDLLKDLGLFGEDEEEEPVDAVMGLAENVVQEIPFVGGLIGGGRVPISSALPFDGDFMKMIESTGNALEEEDYAALTKEWLKPLYYLAMPMGGGQLKKTVEGLSMFEHPIAGSYTDSGALRFPVEDTFGNRVQAGLFGQWANENAREYFDSGRKPLDEKHTKEFSASGLSIQDYWAYQDGLSALNKASEKGKATLAEQADYIFGLDVPIETKNLLINNLSGRKEPIDLSGMGAYSGFEEYDFATDDPEKYEWLKANGITVKEYNGLDEDTKDEYDFAYKYPEKYSFLRENGYSYSTYANADEDGKRALTWASENPAKYQLSKAVTGDLFQYKSIAGNLNDISADKNSVGVAISGSRKKKVVNYINGLDLDYGEKIILYKSEYPGDDSYNLDIVEYLNSRDDLSYDQVKTILEELGMKVGSNGGVSW